jgi:hypothetical protein
MRQYVAIVTASIVVDGFDSDDAAQRWRVTRVLHDLKTHGWTTHVDVCSHTPSKPETIEVQRLVRALRDLFLNPMPHDLIAIRREVEREYGGEEAAKEEMDEWCSQEYMEQQIAAHREAWHNAAEVLQEHGPKAQDQTREPKTSICSGFRLLDNGDKIQAGDQWLHEDGETWETYQPNDNSVGENWQTGTRYNRGFFLPFRRPLCSCPNTEMRDRSRKTNNEAQD